MFYTLLEHMDKQVGSMGELDEYKRRPVPMFTSMLMYLLFSINTYGRSGKADEKRLCVSLYDSNGICATNVSTNHPSKCQMATNVSLFHVFWYMFLLFCLILILMSFATGFSKMLTGVPVFDPYSSATVAVSTPQRLLLYEGVQNRATLPPPILSQNDMSRPLF